jgi:signal transduction histidine kinase
MDSRRRTVFLLAAVLLPSVALAGIALRLLHQERELAVRRGAELRRTAVLQRALVLQRRLDLLSPGDPAVVWKGVVADGHVDLPWDHPRDARGAYARVRPRELIDLDLRVQDEEGMPLAIYAAERLKAKLSVKEIPELSPVALYALLNVARDTSVVMARLRRAEALVRLRNEYASLLATDPSSSAWFLYAPPTSGHSAWLVRFDSTRAVVLDARRIFGGVGLRVTSAERGEALGPAFAGIYAVASSQNPAVSRANLLLLVLLLTIAVAGMSAYIAWRDVRRESRAARMRTQFVSSVSHELKTPLTAIRMYSDLLRMHASLPATKREEYLSTIAHESERLSRLINNVLDFARIERGEKQYRMEDVDVREVARDVERAMAYPLAQSGMCMDVQMDDVVSLVSADRDALSQAILNLVSNAMKFSGESRRIELSITRQNGDALITVADYGRGIPESEHARVFREFYRSPDVDADGIPGTGLGLALVDHVARAHRGSVTLESAPGKGSRFTMRIPVSCEAP